MKKQFLDYFKKSYKTKLFVEARNTVNGSAEQLNGIDFQTMPYNEELLDLLREWRPGSLRIRLMDGMKGFLDACRDVQCSPHFVIEYTAEAQSLRERLAELFANLHRDSFWSPVCYYELNIPKQDIPFDDEDKCAELIRGLGDLAAVIRDADPNAVVIASAVTPYGMDYGRSEIWNSLLLREGAEWIDLMGVTWCYPNPVGWQWDEATDGMETACACADDFNDMVKRLSVQIDRAGLQRDVRVAVSSWGYLKNTGVLTKQDIFFYAAMRKQLKNLSRLIPLAEMGPLYGEEGLVIRDEYGIYTTAAGEFLKLFHGELPIALKVSEMEGEEKPVLYEWAGIEGRVNSRAIRMLDVYAARSQDGKRLYLLAANRHPYRRAELRLKYYNMSEMRPVEARVLRSKKALDRNDSETPEAVSMKEIGLRKYRTMDHVNLDIPESGIVSMLLMAEN